MQYKKYSSKQVDNLINMLSELYFPLSVIGFSSQPSLSNAGGVFFCCCCFLFVKDGISYSCRQDPSSVKD